MTATETPKKCHIVLFDPGGDDVKELRAALLRAGHHVSFATSPAEAIRAIAMQQPAVAIIDALDEHVPELCALRAFLQLKSSIAIILLASGGRAEPRSALFQFNADDFTLICHDAKDLEGSIETLRRGLSAEADEVSCGNTILKWRENIIVTPAGGKMAIAPGHADLLRELMCAYPGFLTHAYIQTEIIHFSVEADTNAVYNRVHGIRRILEVSESDIDLVSVSKRGYRLVVRRDAKTAARRPISVPESGGGDSGMSPETQRRVTRAETTSHG